jgi:hypothetical protein
VVIGEGWQAAHGSLRLSCAMGGPGSCAELGMELALRGHFDAGITPTP